MTKKIILASESPRRKELLAQMGVGFEAMPSNYHEQLDDTRAPADVACELALGKAKAVAKVHPDAVVIGSDTIVAFNGRQLGKQPDAATARKLLRELSGQQVTVTTGVAIVCVADHLQESRAETATIQFAPYTDDVIEAYLRSNDWQDKAGTVAIQTPGAPPIQRITGSCDTLLGLATKPLARMLAAQGINAKPAEPMLPKHIPHTIKAAKP
jgi:septum formation protein